MNAITNFRALGLLFACCAAPPPLVAQIPQLPNPAPDQRILDLELEDLQLRSGVATQRVNRQAEVARLEARIEELESRLNAFETKLGPTLWPFLDLIDADAARTAAAPTVGADGPSSAEPELDPAVGDAPGTSAITSDRRLRLARLMAQDYLLALEADLVDARIEMVDANQSAGSVQRLVAKGLATGLQLKREQLETERAAARVVRLEKQVEGLRELFPELARAASTAPNVDDLPSPKRAADAE